MRATLARRVTRASGGKYSGVPGVSRQTVWRIATGRTKRPSFLVLKRIADFYGVGLLWLALGMEK
ncbi:MAG: helix-turn-helix transcriptional regulator [Gemmatimonadaceae bacterium]|nr:helix-turn-helix transcriptional regulator [Gemmatimonadaceae bacterium]